MKEMNHQVTLFKFQSLRAPELLKEESLEKRFIYHPDNSGVFFEKVDKRGTKTKWQAMVAAAENFNAVLSEKELGSEALLALAAWLSKNKSNINVDELVDMLDSFEGELINETMLWDNLFYQVIVEKSFYAKEAIIELLVLQNLIKVFDKTGDKNDLKQLAKAKVVLPLELFKEDSFVGNRKVKEQSSNKRGAELIEKNYITKEIADAQEKAASNISIVAFENLVAELENAEKKYQERYEEAYCKALAEHEQKIRPLITAYQKEYDKAKRDLCAKPKDANYDPNDFCNLPDVEYPELPGFSFEPPIEFDKKIIEQELSEDAQASLEILTDSSEIKTFYQAVKAAEKEINKHSKDIFSKTTLSTPVLTIGDTAFTVASNAAVGSDFTFQICSPVPIKGKISPYMSFQVPDSSYQVAGFIYHLHYTSINNTSGSYILSRTGNVITLSQMYGDGLPYSNLVTGISGYINFTNGKHLTFNVENFALTGCFSGKLIDESAGGGNSDEETDAPSGFGLRQLGIADYKKVVSHVCCYQEGEVAHIENIMAREMKSKTTTKFRQTQTTLTESNETERESISDTVSTERFEMQTEIAKLLQEQKQVSAFANVHASYGTMTLDAGGAYANNVSKEESNRQAVTQAKDITERAMERIVSRVKTEKTVRVTDEFTEENTHVFDNREGENHVSGVYRFINAIYKNEIYNYGKRLMYEFMVPQPSKLHRLGLQVSQTNVNAVLLQKPIDPRITYTDFTKITEGNYQGLAAKYGADVKTLPESIAYINKTLSGAKAGDNELYDGNTDLQIPEGYITKKAKFKLYCTYDRDSKQYHSVGINLGNIQLYIDEQRVSVTETYLTPYLLEYVLDNYKEKISLSYAVLNYLAFNISVSITCELSLEAKTQWQKDTFDAIMQAYQQKLDAYNQSLLEAKTTGTQLLDSNPLFYRQIEQLVLRKNCISYLIDDADASSKKRFGQPMYNNNATFQNHQVSLTSDMDAYGSFAKFMEQAFEWELMSYNFYPYYWAKREDWHELYQFESNDAIYRSFMQAGMARVVVTVKPGFEDAVMYYMATGKIWNGGQMPVLGDPLYLSIVEELKEQEYAVEETWETVLPTNLVALQSSGVALKAEGLPCGDDCETHSKSALVGNDSKLGK